MHNELQLQPLYTTYSIADAIAYITGLSSEQQSYLDEQVSRVMLGIDIPDEGSQDYEQTVLAVDNDTETYLVIGLLIRVQPDLAKATPKWLKAFSKYDGKILMDTISTIDRHSEAYETQLKELLHYVTNC